MSSRILHEKTAIVFGTSVGELVSKEFAAEGAQLFLAGRTQSRVENLAKQIGTVVMRTLMSVLSP